MNEVRSWLSRHKKLLFGIFAGGASVLIIIQLFYPTDRLPLFASIDGQDVSGWKKQDAIWALNKKAAQQPIAIQLGNTKTAYSTAKPGEVGLKVTNDERIKASDYPWYMRLLPASLFWIGSLQSDEAPRYENDEATAKKFVNETLGKSCNIPPKNSSLEFKDDTLKLVPSKQGGTCQVEDAVKSLSSLTPRLNKFASVQIPVEVKTPAVRDEVANKLRSSILLESQDGINLSVSNQIKKLSEKDVLSWLTFTAKGSQLTYSVDAKKASDYFAKNITPMVAKTAGVTRINTTDFTVTSQSIGATGRTLALTITLTNIKLVLDGEKEGATAVTTDLKPRVVYTRTYSKTSTGIAALLKHYDEEHAGTFGVSFVELGGRGLSANYNSSTRFTTASTYKLFVAYGTLRKVDAGKWKWTDKNIASGRDLATCFDDMIVKSDNACAEALLKKYGLSALTKDIAAIGLSSSGFTFADTPQTTAGDLTLFLTKLQSSQLPIKPAGRDRLLSAMKRNIYRAGIPSGASGQTADKVGFLWGLLHDAAIVYSPKGTYVLTILTDGSTWANIAELTRKIEALR